MGFKKDSIDIIVVGSGITGLSSALHLQRMGFSVVLAEGSQESVSSQSAGFLSGGQTDNFSRFDHGWGVDIAALMWRFGDASYDYLSAFLDNQGIKKQSQRRLRLLVSEEERIEAKKAISSMKAAGIVCDFLSTDREYFASLKQRVLAIQDDGPRAAVVSTSQLLTRIHDLLKCPKIKEQVSEIIVTQSGVELIFESKNSLGAPMVVVAAHEQTAKLVDGLEEILIPYSDQFSILQGQLSGNWRLPGTVFSAHHGYEWGVTTQNGMVFGGGRFLRPLAGIGDAEAKVVKPVSDYLQQQVNATFALKKPLELVAEKALVGLRPCDELPIIGPMFGQERVLLATGFMSQGLTQGFFAGKCLADIVDKGNCLDLPAQLLPSRLRSLS